MEPALATRFLGIKTDTGQGITDPHQPSRSILQNWDFMQMVLSDINDDIFIDPYRQLDTRNYLVYNRKDFSKKSPFQEIGVIEPPGRKTLTGNKRWLVRASEKNCTAIGWLLPCTGEICNCCRRCS
jgi:hypothetical protein